jgi:hypothetical protein
VSPQTASIGGGTLVNVTLESQILKTMVLPVCRFGATTVRARLVVGRSVICMAPPHAAGEVPFALSFDQVEWSAERLTFRFVDELREWKIFGGCFLGFLALAVGGWFWYEKSCGSGATRRFPPGKGKTASMIIPLLQNEEDSAELEKQPFLLKKRSHNR